MNILYITYPLAGVLIFALALGLGVYLTRRIGLGWRLYWIGAAGFVLSQVGHIPFNMVVQAPLMIWIDEQVLAPLAEAGLTSSEQVAGAPLSAAGLLALALFLGLSAGLFEEITRYLVFRFWAKEARTWNKAVLLGAGWGGIEAIFVGLIILWAFIQITALTGADLSALFSQDEAALAQSQIDAYWSASWYDSLLGFVERVFTLPAHIALSVLALQAVARRQIGWVFLAIAWHTLLNAVAVFVAVSYGPYIGEAAIGLMALGSLAIIFALRRPEPEAPDEPWPEPHPPFVVPRAEDDDEQLDSSRYQ
jgi:uncharacterized membrane protein YhfC